MGHVTQTVKTLEEALQKQPKIDFGLCKIPLGTKFNHLTLIYRTLNEGRHTLFVCQCDCEEHNYIKVRLDHLKSNHTTSCGCENKKQIAKLGRKSAIDITGERFGKLVAIEPLERRTINKMVYQKCKCDCGKFYEATAANLRSGHTTHCSDCRIRSLGEEKVKEILNKNNIPYVKEKTFPDCISLYSNRPCFFDFFVDNSYIIEYDGVQHFQYKKNNDFQSNKENQEKLTLQDKHKNQYCKENNIPLIRIPYIHYNSLCIEDLIPETSKFLVE